MPRYHFEFTRPDGAVLFDEQGKELPDLEAAKAHARVAIRTVSKDSSSVVDWSVWTAVIKNPQGLELAAVAFRDVIRSLASPPGLPGVSDDL